MIRFALVDDEPLALKSICEYFERYKEEYNICFQTDTFISGKQFLDASREITYHALFLDIDMPLESGFDVSGMLRDKNIEIPIVFITNHDNLIHSAFQYKALGFVRKTHIESELKFAVQCVLKEIYKTMRTVWLQTGKNSQVEVQVDDIMYIETQNHTTTVYLINKTISTREPLKYYSSSEAFESFIQISPGCIVNFIHIFSIEKETIILRNQNLLFISRRRINIVKEQFLKLSRRLIL